MPATTHVAEDVLARYRAARKVTATPVVALQIVADHYAHQVAGQLAELGGASSFTVDCYRLAMAYLTSVPYRPDYWAGRD